LPRNRRLDGRFRSFDVIWEPRDTIGGDVWWVSPPDEQGRITLALADCNGHGVPGAMRSVPASTSLERIVAANPGMDPSAMLMALGQALRRGLNQDVAGTESNDGCDAVIVRIDTGRRELEFAGAKLGLMHAHADGQVDRLQPARISLGYPSSPTEVPPIHTISCAPTDSFLLVADGITDQVGGDRSPRAYGYHRLTELLKACGELNANAIAQRICDDLRAW
jgi:serine phosphatase RsbU (regulator of sigma subunit)